MRTKKHDKSRLGFKMGFGLSVGSKQSQFIPLFHSLGFE